MFLVLVLVGVYDGVGEDVETLRAFKANLSTCSVVGNIKQIRRYISADMVQTS
jgi:hypothetical protein